MKSKVVIAGGTGSLGQALAKSLLSQGYEVVLLSRTPSAKSGFKELSWDGVNVESSWAKLIPDSILINLAGALVDRVPTKKNIDLLEDSRVEPTLALVKASKEYGAPALWLQMSTLAIYGDAGDVILSDVSLTSPANGPRQMAGVANAWEQASSGANPERMITLRTAVVLQKNSPALNRLATITKWFLGGQVASGKQYFSWIHETDFLRAVSFLIQNQDLNGTFHICSPNPVTNKVLMSNLRKKLNRPSSPRTSRLAITIGSWLIFRTDPALALTGRRAIPQRLLDAGFTFTYPTIEKALEELIPNK